MDEASNLGEELIFGNVIPGSIHGFKFLDIDGDGIFDEETEAGLGPSHFFQCEEHDVGGTDRRRARRTLLMFGADVRCG